MDKKLRRLWRAMQSGGEIEEAAFLQEALRSGTLERERVELTSYLGHKPSQLVAPWTVAYDVARLMGAPAPEPPATSWFCEPIHQSPSPTDIADSWSQNLVIGNDFSPALLAALLTTYFCIQELGEPGLWIDNYWHNLLTATYAAYRNAFIGAESYTHAFIEFHVAYMNIWLEADYPSHYLIHLGRAILALSEAIRYYVGETCIENEELMVEATSQLREFFKNALNLIRGIDVMVPTTENLCLFLAPRLIDYVLKYRSADGILPH